MQCGLSAQRRRRHLICMKGGGEGSGELGSDGDKSVQVTVDSWKL